MMMYSKERYMENLSILKQLSITLSYHLGKLCCVHASNWLTQPTWQIDGQSENSVLTATWRTSPVSVVPFPKENIRPEEDSPKVFSTYVVYVMALVAICLKWKCNESTSWLLKIAKSEILPHTLRANYWQLHHWATSIAYCVCLFLATLRI